MDKQTVNKSIETVVKKIDENPFIIHSESDVQAMIYCELIRNHNKLFPIDLKNFQNERYKNTPIHTEYYFERIEQGSFGRGKIDIVIFNEKSMENINTNFQRIKKTKEYIVRLDHVIEIKFEKGLNGKNIDNFENSIIENDIKKLQRLHRLHEKYSNHKSNLYFVYIRRLWMPGGAIRKRIGESDEKIESACKKSPKIKLHRNKIQFLNSQE